MPTSSIDKVKVGDYVRAWTPARDKNGHTLPNAEGIITEIVSKEVMFSDKYGITEIQTQVHILAEGQVQVFYLEEDYIEVLSD